MSAKNVLLNFENIDCEEKAYWLGFLYADGSVGSKEDKIELGLAEKDLHHIEKFRDFMKITNKICYRESTKSYRISFRSQKCKEDLIRQGCIPKKSLILKFPTEQQVPSNLIKHFIRGYFDGDGWFTNTDSCFQAGIISTEDFIQDFIQILLKNNIIPKNNCSIFDNHIGGNNKKYCLNSYKDVYHFLDWIYKDATIYLDRKYEHYKDFIENGSQYHKTQQSI